MENMLRKRIFASATLEQYIDQANEYTAENSDSELVKLLIDSIEECKTNFNNIQNKIEEKCKSEEMSIQITEKINFQRKYIKIRSSLNTLLKNLNPNNSSTVSVAVNHMQEVQLPKLNLPTFDGKYTNWQSFHNMFCALVHDKNTLTGVQKMHYLKTSLFGEPLSLLQSLPTTEENYQEALDILIKRYDNKRVIIQSHLKAIFQTAFVLHESADSLRRLIDTIRNNLRALHALKEPTDKWSTLLVYLILEKLDNESRKQFELSMTNNEYPTYDQLIEYVEKRCRALEVAIQPHTKQETSAMKLQPSQKAIYKSARSFRSQQSALVSNEQSCVLCKEPHGLYQCKQLQGLTISERISTVDRVKACRNCLTLGHTYSNCKYGKCKVCQQKHHTLLHQNSTSSSVIPQFNNLFAINSEFQSILSTAVLFASTSNNEHIKIRALVDNGSEANYISSHWVELLNLKKREYHGEICGIGGARNTKPQGIVSISITSCCSDYNTTVQAIVLPKITNTIPSNPLDIKDWTFPRNLPLADPFFNQPGEIGLLLGSSVFANILSGEVIRPTVGPTLFKTKLGYIMTGDCRGKQTPNTDTSVFFSHSDDDQLRRFWELEEVPDKSFLCSPEETACEEIYKSTTCRDNSGRYIVKLPFKSDFPGMGNSKRQAIQQFLSLERQFLRNPELQTRYTEFMTEYERLGHMELVNDNDSNKVYYIPHHAVFKEDSLTTKLRVVFNASANTDSGYSLNDWLLVGKQGQRQLIEQIMRFRMHRFALVADIEKMFRQIWINPEDCDFQRIIWRNSNAQPLQEFKLKTVTYGTASAPFAAVRTLHQLADDGETEHPIGSSVLRNDFYVDDLLSGADTIKESLELVHQVNHLLTSGGFHLRKWASNNPDILQSIPTVDKFDQDNLQWDTEDIKTLGLSWRPKEDVFIIKIQTPILTKLSKRSILSDVAKLFDPLGWLSPLTIVGKILMQKLWILGKEWDEPVPEDIEVTWRTFCKQLPSVEGLHIKRFVRTTPGCSLELHGFSDASELGYGAAAYLKIMYPSGEIAVFLLASKTRVAPIRQTSLPRLELCAAVLLVRLLKFINETLQIPNLTIYGWTDSTVVLGWLSDLPRRWVTFVANRVAEIQDFMTIAQWRHVSSRDNPADICSRGAMPESLLNNELWWSGPLWLSSTISTLSSVPVESCTQERRKEQISSFTVVEEDPSFIRDVSDFTRLVRYVAYWLRFVRNCKLGRNNLVQGPFVSLSVLELENSRQRLILISQIKYFPQERHDLSHGQEISKSSTLRTLNPFLDGNGLLRVGGRLNESSLPYEQKHPIIMSPKSHLTRIMIHSEHLRQLHAGTTLLATVLRRRYWIFRLKPIVRKIIHSCLICFRLKATVCSQLMGSLPSSRVEPHRAFLHCGVDYAGPVSLRNLVRRGPTPITKAYIVIFICMTTKAIHIELASDLTSACFIATFTRFVSRRGRPMHMYSDCGTQFKGAQAELKFVQTQKYQGLLDTWMTQEEIQWHFNPPSSPHFGGIWEAGVKSIKFHLKRIVGEVKLTYEEMNTLLTRIEACLNSRPLCQVDSDPDQFDPLTPGHFLIGEPLTAVQSTNLVHVPMNRLSRWKLITKLTQHFWNRWTQEYLHRLQQRPKWTMNQESLAVGDLVLLKEDNIPVQQWSYARVTQTFPGRDNRVRVVSVRTPTGIFTRPISKLCKLPID